MIEERGRDVRTEFESVVESLANQRYFPHAEIAPGSVTKNATDSSNLQPHIPTLEMDE